MKAQDFPREIQNDLIPVPAGRLVYCCLGCRREYDVDSLLYTCPDCGGVFLIEDRQEDRLTQKPGRRWRQVFD